MAKTNKAIEIRKNPKALAFYRTNLRKLIHNSTSGVEGILCGVVGANFLISKPIIKGESWGYALSEIINARGVILEDYNNKNNRFKIIPFDSATLSTK